MIKQRDIFKIIEDHQAEIKRLGVKRVGVFGSYAKNTQKPGSDVDILVEFYSKEKTFDHYVELKALLEKLLHRKVDLVTRQALKNGMKSAVLRDIRYAGL